MTEFDGVRLRDLAHALRLEWLETDGLGGFASGTVVGANTRRYHGLYVAATTPPVGRRVLVAKVEDRVFVDGDICAMSTNVYEDIVHPQGHQCQTGFRLDPWPVFTWSDRGVTLEKSVFTPYKRGVTVLRYRLLESPQPAWLHARPLVAGRDMHHLQRANVDLQGTLQLTQHATTMQPYDPPSAVTVYHPGGEFRADGLWYYNFRYLHELESGLDYIEDLYSPGEIVWMMRPGETAWLVLAQQAPEEFDGEALMEAERKRRDGLLKHVPG
jgi:predicted glycogen debranching enzyme